LKVKATLQARYEELVRNSGVEQPFPIPSAVQRYFNNAYSFEYVSAIRRFVGDAHHVLIVGDGAGRDYYSLKLLGKSPLVMDIASQEAIPDLVIGDANLPLPFAEGAFDAAVVAEVLEHLPQDFRALSQIRALVKDEGTLVVTVPFYHDAESTHVRIHSPASIERLLRAAGWEITGYIEKGGGVCRFVDWLPLRLLLHLANAVSWMVRRRTFYQSVYRWVASIDFWLGGRRNSIHRYSELYGAFIRCRKVSPTDWSEMNRLAFENMHAMVVRQIG
jgi:SAM-dependent methyltransferase